MDAIHKSDEIVYVSEVINMKEFMDEWINLMQESKTTEMMSCSSISLNDLMGKIMNISPEMIAELQSICSIENLRYGEEGNLTNFEEIPIDNKLVSLNLQVHELVKRKADPVYKQMFMQRLKYKNLDWNLVYQYKNKSPEEGHEIQNPEILLTVRVHRPFRNQRPYCTKNQIFLNIDQEFEVLGCQKLIELRDKISCKADMVIMSENIGDKNFFQDVSAKDIYPSGFFYINGIFFNDMRHKNIKDYSKPIIEWSKDSNRGIGPFSTKKMEDTCFKDLTLRLGQPYVYQHQGNCEHLIIFTDVRMLDTDDCLDLKAYPLYKNLSKQRRVHCMICEVTTAKWITYANSRMPYDPSFFCDTCYKSFNYNAQDEKIGTFDAHRYPDRHAAL